MRLMRLLCFLFVLGFSVSECDAQWVSQPPAWSLDTTNYSVSSPVFPAVSSLTGIDSAYFSPLRYIESAGAHGCVVERYIHSTDLAVRGPNGFLLGRLQCPLAEVYGIDAARSSLAEMVGLIAWGLNLSGHAEVLYMPWAAGASATSLVFAPMVVASNSQERYVRAGMHAGRLYVVEATTPRVLRFIDSDSSGLPDSAGLDIVHPLDWLSLCKNVEGFVSTENDDWPLILCDSTQHDIMQHVRLEPAVGGGFVERLIELDADLVAPHFVGHGLSSGLGVLRVWANAGVKFEIEDLTTGMTIGIGIRATDKSWSEVYPSEPLVEGHLVQIVDADGYTSDIFSVGPKRLVALPLKSRYVTEGASFELDGGDFSQSIIEVGLRVGHDPAVPYVPLQSSLISSTRLSVNAPPVTPAIDGGDGWLRVSLVDPSGAVLESSAVSIVLVDK